MRQGPRLPILAPGTAHELLVVALRLRDASIRANVVARELILALHVPMLRLLDNVVELGPMLCIKALNRLFDLTLRER